MPHVYISQSMEEIMMVIMNFKCDEPSSSTFPTWKLYENPFYISNQRQESNTDNQKQIHNLNLPLSTRKLAASFLDLAFIKAPLLESELEMAKTRIDELKAEVECERKVRKKMEFLNKRLARELSEEKKGREALERVCEELAKEISSYKEEINMIQKEMIEERKMLRVAEVIREERVQMKLADAKILLEEKFSKMGIESSEKKEVRIDHRVDNANGNFSFGGKLRFLLRDSGSHYSNYSMAMIKRRGCPEVENPHIKRGIKGFVEFPKVARTIGCSSTNNSKHLDSKLECQKAQLKMLLKQKGSVRINGLIAS